MMAKTLKVGKGPWLAQGPRPATGLQPQFLAESLPAWLGQSRSRGVQLEVPRSDDHSTGNGTTGKWKKREPEVDLDALMVYAEVG